MTTPTPIVSSVSLCADQIVKLAQLYGYAVIPPKHPVSEESVLIEQPDHGYQTPDGEGNIHITYTAVSFDYDSYQDENTPKKPKHPLFYSLDADSEINFADPDLSIEHLQGNPHT